MFSLPENLHIVEGLAPQVGTAAAVIGDYVSLKNAQRMYAVIHYIQGDATDITWNMKRATAVAGTSAAVFTETPRIWSNRDCAASETLVERTAAVNYASGTGQKHKIIIFEVDPAALTDTFDCVCAESTTAIAATSAVSIMYYIVPRYESRVATQPAMITD